MGHRCCYYINRTNVHQLEEAMTNNEKQFIDLIAKLDEKQLKKLKKKIEELSREEEKKKK